MPELPGLPQVYERVKKLQGIVIRAEKVRPDSDLLEFKIASGGRFYARSLKSTWKTYIWRKGQETWQVAWMPVEKQFYRTTYEMGNPLPAGFGSLWPGKWNLVQEGPTKKTLFAGKPALEIPCKFSTGHKVLLYVQPESLLPMGSITTVRGKISEMRYLSVKERVVTEREMIVVDPRNSKRPNTL
ncbi:MAG: hypothetical protein QM758_12545 [Armatimonas sp.]